MTEQEWLDSTDPAAMLHCLEAQSVRGHVDGVVSRPGDRKLRLWCAALFDLSEYGYGEESFYPQWREGKRGRGKHRAGDEYEGEVADVARMWTDPVHDNEGDPPTAVRAALLREIVGNPFRPVTLSVEHRPGCDADPDSPERAYSSCRCKCPWLTPLVLSVASAAYDLREWDRLPVLADALEDAGCEDEAILTHLRGPGSHVRGCHVLDLLLGLG